MTTFLLRGLAVFFVLMVATSIMMDVFQTEFGTVNFFQHHGVFFLIFITLFPRLTLLFSSVSTGGFLWWLGFFICPRILVASLATVNYFHTNPILVTISWLVALGGELFEKWGISGRNRFIIKTYKTGGMNYPHEEVRSHSNLKNDDAIEAEFRKE
jgi:hypothetical protein